MSVAVAFCGQFKSSMCALWIATDPRLVQRDRKATDQTSLGTHHKVHFLLLRSIYILQEPRNWSTMAQPVCVSFSVSLIDTQLQYENFLSTVWKTYLITVGTHSILGFLEVKGLATDASASESDIPV